MYTTYTRADFIKKIMALVGVHCGVRSRDNVHQVHP
jgi:hypothetical protein